VEARFGNYRAGPQPPTGPAPVEARFGNYRAGPQPPTGPAPVEARFGNYRAASAPHRSCTGGGQVWQLPRRRPPPSPPVLHGWAAGFELKRHSTRP
jgi:hypothetical protein